MLNQAWVAMTFTTRERVMLPAMLEGEVSSLPGRKRTLPRACGYRWWRYRHAGVGPPQCWQRTGSAHERDAGIAALGGSRRLGESDEAAARHGQALTRTGRRADYTHRPMTEEPDAIGRPFAFLCENNYLTLNLFRAAPRRAGLGPMTRPTNSRERCRLRRRLLPHPLPCPSCSEDRVPKTRTDRTGAGNQGKPARAARRAQLPQLTGADPT
jgi:hypothetical protein